MAFDAEDYIASRADGTTLALTAGSGGGGPGPVTPDPSKPPAGKVLYRSVQIGVSGEVNITFPELDVTAQLNNESRFNVSITYNPTEVAIQSEELPMGGSIVSLGVTGDAVYTRIFISVSKENPGYTALPDLDLGDFPNNSGVFTQQITFASGATFIKQEGGGTGVLWATPISSGYQVNVNTDPLGLGSHSFHVFGMLNQVLYTQKVTVHVIQNVETPTVELIVNPGGVELTKNQGDSPVTFNISVTPFSGTTVNRASGVGWTIGKVNGGFVLTVDPRSPLWATSPEVVDIVTFTNGSQTSNFIIRLTLKLVSDLDLITVPAQKSWTMKNQFGIYSMRTGFVMAELYHSVTNKRFKGTLTGVIESAIVPGWTLSPKSIEWYIDDAVGIGVLAVQTVQEAWTPAIATALSAGNREQSEWVIPLVLGEKVFTPSSPVTFFSISRKYELQVIRAKERAYTTGLANYLEVHFVCRFVNHITKEPAFSQIAGSSSKAANFTFIVTRTMTALTGGFVDNTIVQLGASF